MLDYSPPLASGTLEDQSDLRRSAEEGKPLILARLAIASKRADFNAAISQTRLARVDSWLITQTLALCDRDGGFCRRGEA
jgi:hypothetical protein